MHSKGFFLYNFVAEASKLFAEASKLFVDSILVHYLYSWIELAMEIFY